MEPMTDPHAVEVDYYPRDGSVFLDTHYLIKGVAGALFWKLAREHQRSRRSEFSLRELRLAGHELRLPEVQDNLSARLVLLQRRLACRDAAVQIVKAGRGRFRVDVHRPLRLNEKVPAACLPSPWAPCQRPSDQLLHQLPGAGSIGALTACAAAPVRSPAAASPCAA